jgi:hypothetical protein
MSAHEYVHAIDQRRKGAETEIGEQRRFGGELVEVRCLDWLQLQMA